MPEVFIKRVNRDRYACGREDVDEIVADGGIHLERMAADHIWIGLSDGGEVAHVNLNSQTPISIRFEPEGNLIGQEIWNEYAETWEEAWVEDHAHGLGFDGLVYLVERLIDLKYHADVFTGESGDAGPVFIARLRAALRELKEDQEETTEPPPPPSAPTPTP